MRDVLVVRSSYELNEEEDAWQVKERSIARLQASFRRIFRLLRQYKFCIRAMPFGPTLINQWVPLSGPDGKFKNRWPPAGGEYSDFQAIYELCGPTGGGISGIERIVECPQCGKWMFKRFSHQRFCSTRCREREFKSSPEWKAKRRDKAREYYWLHKTKNVK